MEEYEDTEEDTYMKEEADDSLTLIKFQEGVLKETLVQKEAQLLLKS